MVIRIFLLFSLFSAVQIQASWDDSLDFVAVFQTEHVYKYKGYKSFFYLRKGASEFKWEGSSYDAAMKVNDTLVIFSPHYNEFNAKTGINKKYMKFISVEDSSVVNSREIDFFYSSIVAVESGFIVNYSGVHLYDHDWNFVKKIVQYSDSVDVLRFHDEKGEVIAHLPFRTADLLERIYVYALDYDASRGRILVNIMNRGKGINYLAIILLKERTARIIDHGLRRYDFWISKGRFHQEQVLFERANPACQCGEILLYDPLTETEKVLAQDKSIRMKPLIQGNLLIYFSLSGKIIAQDLNTGEKHQVWSFAPRWWERLWFINWKDTEQMDLWPNIRHIREE